MLELAATKTAMSQGAGAAMVNAAPPDAGGQAQAETMQAPDDGAWWQGMPMATLMALLMAQSLYYPGGHSSARMMPQAVPSFDPLDALPPVESKARCKCCLKRDRWMRHIAALQAFTRGRCPRRDCANDDRAPAAGAARDRAKADRLAAEQEMAQAEHCAFKPSANV